MGRSLAIPALFLDSKGLKPREELRSVLRIQCASWSHFTFNFLPFTFHVLSRPAPIIGDSFGGPLDTRIWPLVINWSRSPLESGILRSVQSRNFNRAKV
jgi:hypothetical protein